MSNTTKTSTSVNSSKRLLRVFLTSRGILIAASILIAVGYLLMAGPGSTEQAFNPDIFSTRRIVIAPVPASPAI
jgi:hypothetical protein